MAVISVWCSYVLPETYGKKPAEVIEELREEQPQPVKIAKNDVLWIFDNIDISEGINNLMNLL